MKTPAFWYGPPSALATILAPLSCFFRIGGAVRRLLAHPYRAPVPVICVGNVVAGGSGKTPTAIAIAQMLQSAEHRPFFVTRGYGGKKLGPLRMDRFVTVDDVGDEAFLLQRTAPTVVSRDRAAGIRLAMSGDPTHIIMDDGFQNPHVVKDFSILVIDSGSGMGNGKMIPAGPLREPLSESLKRAQAVVVIGDESNPALEAKIRLPLFHAEVHCLIGEDDLDKGQRFLAFAGIGHPAKFYATCRKAGLNVVKTIDFPDHHPYTDGDFDSLKKEADSLKAQLITTEKDLVRLKGYKSVGVKSLPIRLEIKKSQELKALLP